MKNGHTRFSRALGFVVLVLCVARVATPQATQLEPFTISDQLDVVHTDQEFRDRVTVFLGADRKGTAFTQEWWEALSPGVADLAAEDRVALVQFAQLKGVPSFVRGKVKKAFPKDPSARVLLDWKGFFKRTYGFEKDSLNVLVFDDRGQLVLRRAVREFDEAEFKELLAAIRTAVLIKNRDSK